MAPLALPASITRPTLRSPVTQGLLAGLAGSQALDLVSNWLYERESPLARFRENAARGFSPAYDNAAGAIADTLGVKLSRKEKAAWGGRLHQAFGVLGGLLYVAARRRSRVVGAGNGLAFGAAFFLVADELLMPIAGFTPGPRAFSWKVHARGAAAHLAFGVAAETALRVVERYQRRLAA